MGKYTAIAAELTAKPEPSEFQDKVNAVKVTVKKVQPANLAHEIVRIRAEKDAIKKSLSTINVRLVAHEQLLAEAFESSGITHLTLESGDSISTSIKPYARIQDRDAFRAWCVNHGLEQALVLPWQTTNALVSERLMNGQDEPDGIDTYKQTTIILRKGRN